MPTSPTPWWRGAVGYQIYVRSFQDGDGDGLGDLAGIRKRLPYLARLGVDILWLTPFYPSPDADHGYDVADYVEVDPRYGTLEDLDALIEDAHGLGLRVVADVVPNHTSDRHPWFRAAVAEPRSAYRDYYVWRDPGPDGGPPNNWVSHFGGPAWTLDAASGQYYMHLFLPEQPDLNWANPAVALEFDVILRYWLERGIDGFRIDVAHSLVEDPEYRDNPLIGDPPPHDAHPGTVMDAYEHRYDMDQPGVLEVFRRWRQVVEPYEGLLIGEVYLLEPGRLTRYVEEQDGLHTAFYFGTLRTDWDAGQIRTTLVDAVAAGAGALSWPLSSHDDPRAAERFGGGAAGARRSLAYLTLLCGLPGYPFIYQGDELGLDNGRLELTDATDPIATRNVGHAGRDGSRTPMVWEPGDGFGFSSADPWLPFGTNRRDEDTAAAQEGDPGSHLERIRLLLEVRRSLPELVGDGPVRWLDGDATVIGLARGSVVVACNAGARPGRVTLPSGLTDGGEVRFVTTDGGASVEAGALLLAPDTAAIVTPA